jgi:hypothetical protein
MDPRIVADSMPGGSGKKDLGADGRVNINI